LKKEGEKKENPKRQITNNIQIPISNVPDGTPSRFKFGPLGTIGSRASRDWDLEFGYYFKAFYNGQTT
jgi:hypothetical protein